MKKDDAITIEHLITNHYGKNSRNFLHCSDYIIENPYFYTGLLIGLNNSQNLLLKNEDILYFVDKENYDKDLAEFIKNLKKFANSEK